ncbi:MAG: STAS domain-containing protein [Rhodocyclaceae bacterium]|nr:STAS domain-containing protein [Rhodocyclaceae bacterium]
MSALKLADNGLCLEITGGMTVDELPALLAGLEPFYGIAHVDLRAVDRVDSSALSLLLELGRQTRGNTVTVYHAPPSLRALNDLYGLQTLFWVV